MAGIYMLDGERVAYVNQRGAEILGYTRDEALGMRFIEAIDERDRDHVVAQFALRTAGVKSKAGYTVRAVRKDGAPVVLGITSALVTVDGAPTIMGMLQDLTEHEQSKQRILDHARQLEDAMLGTIGAVTAMIEQRDPYTAGHERHVSALGEAIGREMGLSSEQCRGLQIAGTVHDIGKNAISVEILNKNTRLTDAEFALIKAHSQAGYEVLKEIEFPWPVAEAVLQHHERLDGSGYPRGLSGDQIIPEARIIAVADVVESMATHRPYRSALGLDMALEEITQFRGARYDAAAVDACLTLFREKEYRLDGQRADGWTFDG
jgi:PAS domain S-box-containing protein